MTAAGTSMRLLATALAAVLALTAASLFVGAPEPLPSVALGATWLLHLERVVAAALAISAIMTLALRTAHGQLPLKLGATSIEFESLRTSAASGLDGLTVELKTLRDRIGNLESEE